MNNSEFRKMIIISTISTLVISVVTGLAVGIKALIAVLLSGIICTAVFAYYTHKRYESIQKLNTYFSAVIAGEYDLQPGENREGELSILHDNIYKATVLLKSQNERLAKDKVFLAEIMADISHQLKTPVTSISIMNDLLEYEGDIERRREFLGVQRQEVDKMSWLIQNLLKLSKLDAGIVELKREEVSISAVLDEVINAFSIQTELKNIEVSKNNCDGIFLGDKNWTSEVFRNIVKNCIEHMEEGGSLQIESEDAGLYLEVRIRDDGCGISHEDLPHIFERFYRGKDASPGSIGIGLALAKSILDREHGEISADSEPGVGTTFTVRFYRSII